MVIAIIQARLGSTRLPRKVLLEIMERPLLSYMIERVKKATHIDKIVIATTTNKIDNDIETLCSVENIACFRGNENDVLDRYYKCALKYEAKTVVRLTSDCPLIDPNLIDDVVNHFQKNKNYDYVANTAPPPGTYPDGMDVEVFSYEALEKAWHLAKKKSEREHVTFFFWKNPDLFDTFRYDHTSDYSRYRLTIDYYEDFMLIEKIINHFKHLNYTMDAIIAYLEKNDELLKLNHKIQRNSGWEASLREDEKLL
jgi:spore coat polysaccharide biosynthesis protein SpsF